MDEPRARHERKREVDIRERRWFILAIVGRVISLDLLLSARHDAGDFGQPSLFALSGSGQ
jgi:hypothetical protein